MLVRSGPRRPIRSRAATLTGWTGDVVGYRDTKQAERPTLVFSGDAARAFLNMIKTTG